MLPLGFFLFRPSSLNGCGGDFAMSQDFYLVGPALWDFSIPFVNGLPRYAKFFGKPSMATKTFNDLIESCHSSSLGIVNGGVNHACAKNK